MNNSSSDVDKSLIILSNMSEDIDTIIDDAQTYLSLAGIDLDENRNDLNWIKYILPDGKHYYSRGNEISYELPEYIDGNLIVVEKISYENQPLKEILSKFNLKYASEPHLSNQLSLLIDCFQNYHELKEWIEIIENEDFNLVKIILSFTYPYESVKLPQKSEAFSLLSSFGCLCNNTLFKNIFSGKYYPVDQIWDNIRIYYLECMFTEKYNSLLEHLSYFLSLTTEEYICHEQFEIASLPDDNYFIELLNGMEEISCSIHTLFYKFDENINQNEDLPFIDLLLQPESTEYINNYFILLENYETYECLNNNEQIYVMLLLAKIHSVTVFDDENFYKIIDFVCNTYEDETKFKLAYLETLKVIMSDNEYRNDELKEISNNILIKKIE